MLAYPGLAFLTLPLMLAGIVGRSVCEPLTAEISWLGPLEVVRALNRAAGTEGKGKMSLPVITALAPRVSAPLVLALLLCGG